MYDVLLVEADDDDTLVTFDEFEKSWHASIHVSSTFTGRAHAKTRIQAIHRQINAERKEHALRSLATSYTVRQPELLRLPLPCYVGSFYHVHSTVHLFCGRGSSCMDTAH